MVNTYLSARVEEMKTRIHLHVSILAALAVTPCVYGGNVMLTDQFNVAPCSIPPPANDPSFNQCDVIGAKTDFDLEKAAISLNRVATTITIYQNYRNNAVTANGFGSFSVGAANIGMSDVFFGNGSSILYGISMATRNGFQAGSLYAIGNGVTARTAASVLNLPSPPYYYRTTRNVMLGGTPAQSLGIGAVSTVSNAGDGISNAEYRLQVQLGEGASGALYDAAQANGGQLDIYLNSATCGNDVLDGRINTPEPGAFALMGTVVVALGVAVRRRRKLEAQTPAAGV